MKGLEISKFSGISNVLLFFLCLNMTGQIEIISWKAAQHQDKAWYATQEAQRIADNVLRYQHQNGGWLKNIEMTEALTANDKNKLEEENAAGIGTTIDNGATYTQLKFLAKVNAELPNENYQKAFLKGLDYLLKAQYENGGWAQYFPEKKGYYEHITYNDNAMIGVMRLLRNVANGENPYEFVDKEKRKEAQKSIDKGLQIILKTQIRINGELTVWCAQYDKEYLSPAKARAYELPSLSGSESVGIVNYLMELPNPDDKVKTAVQSAIKWFENNAITGKKVVGIEDSNFADGKDRIVVDDPDGAALWARFNEIGTNKPMFVGRDGVVKNHLSEIEHERRVGYSYLSNYAESLLKKNFPAWQKKYLKER